MSGIISLSKTTSTRGEYTVVTARHPWRWVAAVAVTAVVVLGLISAVTNPRFGWDKVALYFRDTTIVNGIGITHMTTDEAVAENLLLLQVRFLRQARGLGGGVDTLEPA